MASPCVQSAISILSTIADGGLRAGKGTFIEYHYRPQYPDGHFVSPNDFVPPYNYLFDQPQLTTILKHSGLFALPYTHAYVD
jgi:hypothetical protein